jgi:hypothetical protein
MYASLTLQNDASIFNENFFFSLLQSWFFSVCFNHVVYLIFLTENLEMAFVADSKRKGIFASMNCLRKALPRKPFFLRAYFAWLFGVSSFSFSFCLIEIPRIVALAFSVPFQK